MPYNIYTNEKILCITEDYYISYNNGFLSLYDTGTKMLIQKCTIDKGIKTKGIVARLLRHEPRCAAAIDDHSYVFSYDGKILYYDVASNEISIEHIYDKGMKNPLCFCSVDDGCGQRTIYYGEYIWNLDKGPVAIYMRKNSTWKKIFEFKNGTITHIHNVIFDRFRKVFYILTGDSDTDSGIWIADIGFQNVTPLVIGKQKYRSCVAFPTEEGLIYATDTPIEKNYIFKLMMDGTKVRSVETICAIPGPCIYGTKVDEKYVFATSVEPDATLPRWRYRITNKLGKGVEGKESHLIITTKTGEKVSDYCVKKDAWPIWLFQFGNFQFPANSTHEIYAISQALVCGHGVTLKIGG